MVITPLTNHQRCGPPSMVLRMRLGDVWLHRKEVQSRRDAGYTATSMATMSRRSFDSTCRRPTGARKSGKAFAGHGFPEGGDFFDFSIKFRDGQEAESIRTEVESLADSIPVWNEIDSKPDTRERTAVLVRLSEVTRKAVRWLWQDRIAIGKV